MVIILNIVDKIPLDKNIKLYRLIQNLLCPNIVKGPKYSDIKLNDITLRIFDPNNKSKILIYIHGGGWVSGNLDTHCNICYKLAEKLNRKVISIGYRLAPEYPFPAGLNDCYIVTKNIMENIEKLNIKSKDVIIMGDSAGANLAMSVSLMGLHNKTFRVGKIIMIYPTTQTDYSKKSIYKSLFYNDNKGFLTRKYLENWTNMYLPNEESKDNQYANLMKAKRLLKSSPLFTVNNPGTFSNTKAFGWIPATNSKYLIVNSPLGSLRDFLFPIMLKAWQGGPAIIKSTSPSRFAISFIFSGVSSIASSL